MGAGVSLNLDENIVKPIIEAEIQTAIVRQLQSGAQDLIPALVRAALHEKVNIDGKRSNSSYENRYEYIDLLCKNAIQSAAKAAMVEYIESHTEALKLEVACQIHAATSDLAKVFVEGLVGAIKTNWSFTVKVTLPSNE